MTGEGARDAAARSARISAAEAAYRRDGARFVSEESDLLRWARPLLPDASSRGRAMDLGCGPGRDSVALARIGFQTIGVDQAPTAIRRAHRLAHADDRGIVSFVEADMLDFLDGQPDGSVLVAFASLSYATLTTSELAHLGRALAHVLVRGGLHFFSVRDETDPHAREGSETEPGVRMGGPHAVPYRYFTEEALGLLETPELRIVRKERRPERHLRLVEAVRE
jgi:SAM-dependent methyltransferase